MFRRERWLAACPTCWGVNSRGMATLRGAAWLLAVALLLSGAAAQPAERDLAALLPQIGSYTSVSTGWELLDALNDTAGSARGLLVILTGQGRTETARLPRAARNDCVLRGAAAGISRGAQRADRRRGQANPR